MGGQSLLERIDAHLKQHPDSIVTLPPEFSFNLNLGEEYSRYQVLKAEITVHATAEYVVGPNATYAFTRILNAFMETLLPSGISPERKKSFKIQGNWMRHGHILIEETIKGLESLKEATQAVDQKYLQNLDQSQPSGKEYILRTIFNVLPYSPAHNTVKKFTKESHMRYQTPMSLLQQPIVVGR